jgi:hypothetical protein
MKTASSTLLLATTITLLSNATCHAGPTENAILAAMALSDKPNYSWTSTVMDDAQVYTIEGKTQQQGAWTWLRLPMIKSVARRIGEAAEGELELEAVFKGNTDSVIHTAKGWEKLKDIPWWEPVVDADSDDVFAAPNLPRPRQATRGIVMGATDPFATDPAAFTPVRTPPRENDERRPYSNMQYGVSRPHEELAVIVSSCADLTVEGNTVRGTLTDGGAQLLLVRDGQEIVPLAGAGTFKLQIKDGMVVSYLVQLEGILELGPKKRVHVRQTSNTVLKNVGTTKFEVPEEARRKLGS